VVSLVEQVYLEVLMVVVEAHLDTLEEVEVEVDLEVDRVELLVKMLVIVVLLVPKVALVAVEVEAVATTIVVE